MTPEFQGLCPLLAVYDMTAARAFYQVVLGFETVQASPLVDAPEGRFSHWVWLRRDGAELMLNTAYDEGERPAARVAEQDRWHRDATLYIGCADVDAMYADLKAKGLDLAPPQTRPYGMRQLTLTDPDGYGVCFQAPAD